MTGISLKFYEFWWGIFSVSHLILLHDRSEPVKESLLADLMQGDFNFAVPSKSSNDTATLIKFLSSMLGTWSSFTDPGFYLQLQQS